MALYTTWEEAEPTGRIVSRRKGTVIVTNRAGQSIFDVETIVTEWVGLSSSLALQKVAENEQPLGLEEAHIWTATEDDRVTRSFTLRRTYERRPV